MKTIAFGSVLTALDTSGIRYLVQRGHEHFPEFGGDLDLLVHLDDLEIAIALAAGAISPFATPVICRHVDLPVVWGGLSTGPAHSLEIDFATCPTWAAGPILDPLRVISERVRDSNGFWRARPGDESALNGIPALLGRQEVLKSKGIGRLEGIIHLIEADADGALRAWTEAIGSVLAKRVLIAIRGRDLRQTANIGALARSFRFGTNLGTHPLRTLRRVRFVRNRAVQANECGLWHQEGTSLVPVRSIEIDPQSWASRLRLIEAKHSS